MFQRDFEKREKQRKRPATEALEDRHKRAKHTLSSRWTKDLHNLKRLYKHDQGSSRKTRASPVSTTSRRLGEDRHSRRSQRDRRDLNLKSRRSKHTDKEASSRHRTDGSRRHGFDSSHTNNSGNSPSSEDEQEPRQARSKQLCLSQDAKEKSADDCGPAEKFQRFHPLPGLFGGTDTIRHELTNPAKAKGVEVVYTSNKFEAEKWLRAHIVDCSAKAVGLDTEQKPQFVSKKDGGTENEIAVLQLGVEKSCLVMHLYCMGELPKSLKSILKDENILKIGSGIDKDASKLKRERGLVCKGLLDTQDMATSLGLQKIGLKALAERFLDIELDKVVALSNWEHFPLQVRQVEYAALDAWVGLKVYQEMKRQRKSSEDIKTSPNINQSIIQQMINFRRRKENKGMKGRQRKF